MDIVHGWYEVPQHVKDGALVIGTFDGTPRGHRAVLDAAKAKASNGGLPVGATIFEPTRKEQKPFFRLTQLMRDLAEQVIKQAHAAYEQLAAFVTKAMDAWVGTMPSPMATGFKDVRERAMDFAKENAELVFTFAGKISNARTPQEILTLQTQFAQDQMKAFTTQTQELYKLIGETVQKLQHS